jgi:phosphoribosylanthranilate isomerase
MTSDKSGGVRVKICGLTRPEDMHAAIRAGAAYVGLNFFPKSPRSVTPAAAADLAKDVPTGVTKVSLTVNASADDLDAIVSAVPLDMLQLHGDESPEYVSVLRARYGLPIMKVVGLASEQDLPRLDLYTDVADMILIDAKPPKGAALPGGNGVAFDWRLIAGRNWSTPWMLAGGLTPDNVAEAIRLTGATQVDVASGVEAAPGLKDAARMSAFVKAAQ